MLTLLWRRRSDRGEMDKEGQPTCNSGWNEHWIEAASRLCRVDDGIPDELDIIGSRDNRNKRLKALGNSIVPQVAYEIFNAINQVEERKTA